MDEQRDDLAIICNVHNKKWLTQSTKQPTNEPTDRLTHLIDWLNNKCCHFLSLVVHHTTTHYNDKW